MADDDQPAGSRETDREVAIFVVRVLVVEYGQGVGVQENGDRLVEANAVLAEVRRRFDIVPFEVRSSGPMAVSELYVLHSNMDNGSAFNSRRVR